MGNVEATRPKRTPGIIYIMRNPFHAHALVKVGLTTRVSEERARELSQGTGVPSDFEVMYEERVADAALAERLIHKELVKYRVNERREFFRVPMKVAVRAVFHVCMMLEQVLSGKLEPRLALLVAVPSAAPMKFAGALRRTLTPHVGGNCRVSVFLSGRAARAVLTLGREWKVHLSKKLVTDLKKVSGLDDWVLLTDAAGSIDDDAAGLPF